jgi:hypothetical protein
MKAKCGEYGGRILLGESAYLLVLDHVQCCTVVVSKWTLVLSTVLSAVLSVL